jgi:DNA-binding NtrC family response regulator
MRQGKGGSKTLTREVIEPWLLGMSVAAPRIETRPIVMNGNGSNHANGVNGNGYTNGHSATTPLEPPAIMVKPLEDLEREAIVFALRRFNGHRQKTAAALGIGVRTLGLKLKKWKQERLVAESL